MGRQDPESLGTFLVEWAVAVNRAVWFPLIWLLGLEGQAVELNLDDLPLLGENDPLRQTVVVAKPRKVSGHRN